MIINCEKWGSIAGSLSIENAFSLTQNVKINRDSNTQYINTRGSSSRGSPRSSFLSKRNKKKHPQLYMESILKP